MFINESESEATCHIFYRLLFSPIFFLFSATEASASRSWLDVPGIAVPACVQSICHRGFRRCGTGFVHAEVTCNFISVYTNRVA